MTDTVLVVASPAATSLTVQTAPRSTLSTGQQGPSGPRGIQGLQGLPTTVNGKTGESITLNAHDVGSYSQGEVDASLAAKANAASLAPVATSGVYGDLSGRPNLGASASLDVGTTAGTVAAGDALAAEIARAQAAEATRVTAVQAAAAAPVQSIAGRTGAVTLSASDVAGLSPIATSGAYGDLSGRPSLSSVATSGAYADLSGKPTLGTAAGHSTGDFEQPANKGAANGYAGLDSASAVPLANLQVRTSQVTRAARPVLVTNAGTFSSFLASMGGPDATDGTWEAVYVEAFAPTSGILYGALNIYLQSLGLSSSAATTQLTAIWASARSIAP